MQKITLFQFIRRTEKYFITFFFYLKWLFYCCIILRLTLKKNKKKRSVVFIGNCYYSFYYLAEALKKRGWDALSIDIHSHSTSEKQFLQNIHLNLYHPNKNIFLKKLKKFYKKIAENYSMIHFYGSFHYWPTPFPFLYPDISYLKKIGTKIGYSPTGCMDGVLQSEIYKITEGLCNKCIWQKKPWVCSDTNNQLEIKMIA
ncbi:MAG: hypothetical protein REH83_07015, partial [Rickettsiella sp.]|nr:hypothetical protein [Rickettsiella sp.]